MMRHATAISFISLVSLAALDAALRAASSAIATIGDQARWSIEAVLKGRSIIIDPATGERREIMDEQMVPPGIVSPDGKRIVFTGSDPQRVEAGHDFDLFIAEVDYAQPTGKGSARRLTTHQLRPTSVQWLPGSDGIVFLAGEAPPLQVWFVDLAPGATPVRLSDSSHHCLKLSVISDGRVAWLEHKGSRKKEQFIDLMLHPSPRVKGKTAKLLEDQHISSYAFSPDGKRLAWSGAGSIHLIDLAAGSSREIPLHGMHRQLLNHAAHELAWRPDGKIIAMRCGFLGGISHGLNADPNEPWPRMFAEDKVFFLPVAWELDASALLVGQTQEDFPSPTADDPEAEVSPPAGDESQPWWVREVERVLELRWVETAREEAVGHE